MLFQFILLAYKITSLQNVSKKGFNIVIFLKYSLTQRGTASVWVRERGQQSLMYFTITPKLVENCFTYTAVQYNSAGS